MKKNIDKIIIFTEISLFIFIIFSSIYLKQKAFLCSIDFSNITTYLSDQMLFNIEYNEFQNILIIFSFIILVSYLIIYYFIKTKYKVDIYDKVYLFYFVINFLICFLPKFSTATNGSANAQQVAMLFSSLTFLQINFLNVIPYGCILYIPLIYSFFIKRRLSL